jgi:predicted transcriptional regulator
MSIDIPDDLQHQLKILASNRRVMLKTLVRRAIENEMARTPAESLGRLVFPILDSKEPKLST